MPTLHLVPARRAAHAAPGPLQWYMALIAGLSILCFLNAGLALLASLLGLSIQ